MNPYRDPPPPSVVMCQGTMLYAPHPCPRLFSEGMCQVCWLRIYCMALLTGAKEWPK